MIHPTALHEYRVRFASPVDRNSEIEIRAAVDRVNETITYALPNQERVTVDVVTARALHMLLYESVYGSLRPSGPFLVVERNKGDGW